MHLICSDWIFCHKFVILKIMKLAKGLQPIGMFSYSIPNEYVLLVGVLVLIALISWEYYDTQVLLTFGNGKQEERIKSPHAMKIENELGTSENASCASDEYVEYPQSTTQTAEVLSSIEIIPNSNTNTSSDAEQDRDTQRISIYRERISISTSVVNLAPKELSEEEVKKMVNKIMDPLPPGCEPFGPNADLMSEKFPQLTRPDIVRYLVARKGNVTMALEMAEKCLEWRLTVFPLKRDDLSAAVATGCFFPYKTARDGTPCVYMRGGLYDNAKATPEQFVLAASYAIEYSLRTHPDQINVTVVVDTVIIPGAPNLGADMTFIKLFVKTLSDNYPERLKRIIMYPFPWYGRAIWSLVKVFIDKRTQDKALLIGDSGKREIPSELASYVDPDNIPECCAGNCKEPILDLMTTL